MAYHSITKNVYHLFQNCTDGNEIEKENFRVGTGGKRFCSKCEEIMESQRSNRTQLMNQSEPK